MRFDELIKLAQAVVKRKSFINCQDISDTYCPYAIGINNGGLIIPSADILYGVPAIDVWFNMLAFYDVKHLDYWIQEMENYRTSDLLSNVLQEKHYFGCQEHLLPFMQYTPIPEQITCRKGTIMELMTEYNMISVLDLKTYLFCLVTMGIFVNNMMSEQILRIENESEYIAARLFQGDLDAILTAVGGSNSAGGYFMNGANQGDLYSSQAFYRSIQGQLNSSEFKQLLTRERVRVQKSVFIGNEVPQVIAMKDALQLSDTYSKYLEKRDDRFAKVGQRVFDSITLANSARKEFTWKNPANREATVPTFVNPYNYNYSLPFEAWITQGGNLTRFKPALVSAIVNMSRGGGYNPNGNMPQSEQMHPGVI